jgi:predicted Zn-dependent peptidase
MTLRVSILVLLMTLVAGPLAVAQDAIPESPSDLVFPELEFQPPSPGDARVELPGGVPCFVVEDDSVPVVTLGLRFRAGSFDDPEGKEGLAAIAMQLLRTGGTDAMTPEELSEELERLAIDVSAGAGDRALTVSASCLTEDLGRCVELVTDMVRRPRLDESRLALIKAQTMEGLRHRFDAPSQVAQIYLDQILYRGHPASRMVTASSVEAITVEDIRQFLEQALQPATLIVDMGGDVDKSEAGEILQPLLDGWEDTGFEPTDPPAELDPLPPGVYVIDVPAAQAIVYGAQPSMSRHDPDYDPDFYAMRVGNMVLGGGFSSRLTQRIRVQEGLAYAVQAYGFSNVGYPGQQLLIALVDAPSAARACQIMEEELSSLSAEPPTPEETARAKQGLFATWVGFFESASSIASDYASLLMDDMPLSFYLEWYDKTAAPTAADVSATFEERVPLAEMRWVIAGPAEALTAEPEDGPSLAGLGPVTVLTPGDPTGQVELP